MSMNVTTDLNITEELNETFINKTESGIIEAHEGFLHGFVEALSVILVSELGDKTFFIAAILGMVTNNNFCSQVFRVLYWGVRYGNPPPPP